MACTRTFVLAAALLSAASLAGDAQTTAPARPVILVAELDGIIHPISAEYLTRTIDEGDAAGASLIVFVLRTPGGLLDATRTIVSRMITSRAPVAVFVGPSGGRAASAGFIITIAADVAAMAPGTHIGAAHPVSGNGEAMDPTMSEKAASDTAAYARTLAQARGRNVDLAAEAVLKSRAYTDREALEASPPLIDITAQDVDGLIRQLDGRTIKRFDGRMETIKTANADVRRVVMTRRQEFLNRIADPQIAYLLMTLGTVGLIVELWNPGAVLPGVAGGLSLLLAFFALQILPVNTTGVLLVLFGLGLLLLELKIPSYGVLGIGGTASLLIGSIMMTRETPGVTVSLGLIIPVVVAVAVILLFLGRLALRVRANPPATGVEALIGTQGRTRTPIGADTPGQIDLHGEIWRALSRTPLDAGETVRVTEVNGLTLLVEPARAAMGEGDTQWKG
jgi:membrane-bound serine protease (ClpP class)